MEHRYRTTDLDSLFHDSFIARDVLIPFATDPSINTYVGMTTAEGGGIAYVGTICGDMKYRTAVIGKPGNL